MFAPASKLPARALAGMAAASFAAVGVVLVAQHQFGVKPCPWCVLQRAIYLLILATHILLSMFIVPGALTTFYFAWRKSFARHRRIARVLLPIWLYVSVTGVVIFFMLRGSAPAVP